MINMKSPEPIANSRELNCIPLREAPHSFRKIPHVLVDCDCHENMMVLLEFVGVSQGSQIFF